MYTSADQHREDAADGATVDDAALSDADHRAALGRRIRELRTQRHLSLTALARHVGSSASFLSQLERGTTSASVSTLRRISSGVGVTLAELFDEEGVLPLSVLRRDQRPRLDAGPGTHKYLLTPPPLRHLEVYAGEFEPGAGTGEKCVHGDAQELLVVIAGTVRVEVGDSAHVLYRGDSLEYSSALPHRSENCGEEPAEVMWIVSPPTED